MKREEEIDNIFRAGIPGTPFEGKDALWQRIEKGLDKEPQRKQPLLYIITLVCLVIGGLLIIQKRNGDKQPAAAIVKTETKKNRSVTPLADDSINSNSKTRNVNEHFIPVNRAFAGAAKKKIITKGMQQAIITKATAAAKEDDYNNETAVGPVQLEKIDFEPEQILLASNHLPGVKIKNISPPPLSNKNPVRQKKLTIDLTAGVNIASFKKAAGFYAGVAVNKHLKNDAAVSAALLYSASNLSEKYRLSNKPAYNRETDAVLNKISMLQLSLQFRQQIKGSKIFVSAGLMPLYILNAAVDNVPSLDSSTPALYRRFTLKDINRFNVLFTTSARYQLLPGLYAEIGGSYGLTGLVKNSYINQSNLKGNFRSVQLGLVYTLR